jgi:broad specificity phosphatase PhoE
MSNAKSGGGRESDPGVASSRLVLIKHARPQIDPRRPACDWDLSDAGRLDCEALAGRLCAWSPARVVASREPKAEQTGRIVAARLGIPFETADGLREHDRRAAGYLSEQAFQAAVARLFAEPDRLVFGAETAGQAEARFAGAIAGVLERHAGETAAIVAHGTVIALFAARRAGLEPLTMWRRLGLPSYVVLSAPGWTVEEIVDSAGAQDDQARRGGGSRRPG